jgi:hypothetical protein
MIKFITPIIILGASIAAFFVFTKPMYDDIGALRTQIASYNEALDNSKTLENERDVLTNKYNAIDPSNLTKIQTLLPDSIDNIRLILEIGQIAAPYGMVLKDVQYNATNPTDAAAATAPGGVVGAGAATAAASPDQNYGVWDLSFSTTGTYNNFINFTKDLESNLRIVDISSVQFSADDTSGAVNSNVPPSYNYSFKIKTYWLKQ